MKLNIKELSPTSQFIFLAVMKSATLFKEMGKDKRFFVRFAEEIWNSMEESDFDTLKADMEDHMNSDIEKYAERLRRRCRSGGGTVL